MHYADYMLNKKTKRQTQAFIQGVHSVISQQQLSYFFPDEIQMLITGT